MNSNIADRQLTTGNEVGKKHQAYNMELSRLQGALKKCPDAGNCPEYEALGGANREKEITPVVEIPKKTVS